MAPGDFLRDLARRDMDLRRVVDGATRVKGQQQLVLHAFPDHVAGLRASLAEFRRQGLTTRGFVEGKAGSGTAAPKQPTHCEFEWKGEACPRGAKCDKVHSQKQ